MGIRTGQEAVQPGARPFTARTLAFPRPANQTFFLPCSIARRTFLCPWPHFSNAHGSGQIRSLPAERQHESLNTFILVVVIVVILGSRLHTSEGASMPDFRLDLSRLILEAPDRVKALLTT